MTSGIANLFTGNGLTATPATTLILQTRVVPEPATLTAIAGLSALSIVRRRRA